jgi:hypothetical protein
LLNAALEPETEVERVEVARVELAPAQVADGPAVLLQAGDAFLSQRTSRIPNFDKLVRD